MAESAQKSTVLAYDPRGTLENHGFKRSVLRQGKGYATRTGHIRGAFGETLGEFRQVKQLAHFQGQSHQGFGALAMQLGKVQVMRRFQDDGNLGGEGTCSTDVLLR